MPRVLLVRHGQASWGKADYDQLSEVGIQQGAALGRWLAARAVKVDAVVCGAMRRHQQTASACLTAAGLPVAFVEDPRWNEFDHQEVIEVFRPLYRSRVAMMADLARTGRPRTAFQEMFDAALERWVRGEAGYQEAWTAFRARVADALAATASREGTTLVFTSGGPISAVVAGAWGVPDDRWTRVNRVVANGGVTTLLAGRRGVHVSVFNEHSHLEADGLVTLR